MKQYRILCIDDDEYFLRSLESSLPRLVAPLCPEFRCAFECVSSAEELFESLGNLSEDEPLAMVISDQMMTNVSGIDLIERIKQDHPGIVSMLLTGHGRLESAKYAINHNLLDQYTSKPIEDLHVFASSVANLLKRHHSDLQEQERTRQLAKAILRLRAFNEEVLAMQSAAERIARLSKDLKSLDPQEVVAAASRELPMIFNAARAVIYLAPEGCPVELSGQSDHSCAMEKVLSRPEVREALHAGQYFRGAIPEATGEASEESIGLVIPLSRDDQSASDCTAADWRGCLCLYNVGEDPHGTIDMIKYKADLVGEILATSLSNAVLHQQAKQDGLTDSLTGAGTRRVLEMQLQQETDRAARCKGILCVAVIDVDMFKAINDHFGHNAGDRVLNRIADILRGEMRSTDTLVRYGGDEFVILMSDTELADAVTAVERMRSRTESTLMSHGRAVTISCGVAEWSPSEHETGNSLLRRADAAMYRAKSVGRNNVQVEEAA